MDRATDRTTDRATRLYYAQLFQVESQPTAANNNNWLSPGTEMAQNIPAMPTSGPGGDAISIQDCSPGWPHGACQVIKQL
jgi:hypothetical protein